MALGSEAAPPQASNEGLWSLVSISIAFPCLCAWVHYGLWLFYAALANSEPSSQPLSAMSTTHSGTVNILWALLWAAGDSKLSDPFLPRLARLPSLLYYCSNVPRKFAAHSGFMLEQGTDRPCSWNPPNQDEHSVILAQSLITANQGLQSQTA